MICNDIICIKINIPPFLEEYSIHCTLGSEYPLGPFSYVTGSEKTVHFGVVNLVLAQTKTTVR